MGINGNYNINQVTTVLTPLEPAPGFLTPEALMSYCQTRLRGIDEQIQGAFAKQQQANHDSKALSDLSQSMGSCKNNLDKANGQNALQDLADKYYAAAKNVSDPDLKASLIAQGKKCETDKLALTNDGLTAEQYKQYGADFVASAQKDLNAGTELSMINLQSLMSQRQSSVQLVTNMVQALGDQMNKIASNIGH